MWIRHVLVPGLTDQEDDLKAMRGMLDELKTVKKVEILPYHSLGLFKWQNLGIPYTLEGVPAPTKEEVERARSFWELSDNRLTGHPVVDRKSS